MRLLENRSDRVGRPNDNHSLRLRSANGVDGPADVGRLPLVGCRGHGFGTFGFQGFLDATEDRGPKSIVWVDDANLSIAQRVPSAIDLLARLVVVGSTDIHDPMAQGRVESLGAGEQPDQGYLLAFRQRNVLHRGWSTD